MPDSETSDKPTTRPIEKKVREKVVKGEVQLQKPRISDRIRRIFFGGDMETAAHYVMMNVVFPAIRDVLAESITKGADQFIYGGDRGHRPSRPRGYSDYQPRVQYHRPMMSEPRGYLPDRGRPMERWQRNAKPFQNILVHDKADADMIVEQMIGAVEQYQVVSVADLMEMLGQPFQHTDNKWGWTNLSRIEVRQTRDGYSISFPDVEEI